MNKTIVQPAAEPPTDPQPTPRLSAKATRDPNLTEKEIQAAEEEAEAWARRVNSC